MASDDGSGVHRIEYSFFVANSTVALEKGAMPANRNNATRACIQDPRCNCVLETCFLREQTLDFDNCRFLVPKEDLNKSARIEVTVYNQALLYDTFTINIRRLTDLGGLEEYSGPTNIHIEKNLATGVRLVWDLPKKASCYGRADIDVVVVDSGGRVKVIHVHNEGTFIDLVGLEPDNDYSISLKLGYRGTELAAQPYKFKTAPKQNYLEGSVIAGIVASAVAVIGIIISIVVVTYRQRRMQPEKDGLKALSFKYRNAVDAINKGEKKNNSEM
ncbi:uncharacterized protein LOC128550652 [Mercenaria mercenaria]|uniref:uncharacterized protein LOC128550652 n=1 Tax=Mercenaria mercenaria TaxID=6596 RepID=UPI00234F6B61|nr:uncharacterized protein LOC128550652 [Mercenaria mercenaria]